jgi:hypothetical protein
VGGDDLADLAGEHDIAAEQEAAEGRRNLGRRFFFLRGDGGAQAVRRRRLRERAGSRFIEERNDFTLVMAGPLGRVLRDVLGP